MPRVKPKPAGGRRPFKPGELVVAVEAGFLNGEEGETYFSTGQKFNADDEVVRSLPGSFMPADTVAADVVNWLPPVPETPEYESEFRIREPEPIPVQRQVICVEWTGTTSRQVKAGTVLDLSDPLVRAAPANFVWHRRLSAEDVK